MPENGRRWANAYLMITETGKSRKKEIKPPASNDKSRATRTIENRDDIINPDKRGSDENTFSKRLFPLCLSFQAEKKLAEEYEKEKNANKTASDREKKEKRDERKTTERRARKETRISKYLSLMKLKFLSSFSID